MGANAGKEGSSKRQRPVDLLQIGKNEKSFFLPNTEMRCSGPTGHPPPQKRNCQALFVLLYMFSDIFKKKNPFTKICNCQEGQSSPGGYCCASECVLRFPPCASFNYTFQSTEASLSDFLPSITLQDNKADTPLSGWFHAKMTRSPSYGSSLVTDANGSLLQPSAHSVLFLTSLYFR